MAAHGGLVTYGSLVAAGMVTGLGEQGAGLFDHLSLSRHKCIYSLAF